MAQFCAEHFFRREHLVGTRTVHVLYSHGAPAIYLRNLVLVCPECGEIWGRSIFSPSPLRGWNVTVRYCDKHGGGYFIEEGASPHGLIDFSFDFLVDELLLFSKRVKYDYFKRIA